MHCHITGCRGLLGRALMKELSGHYQVTGSGHEDLDICDVGAVEKYLDRLRPQVLINAAGFTYVDQCESMEEKANAVNGSAVGTLAHACAARGIHMVQLSTDYVFDGKLERPYREDDAARPLNAYGRSKLLGETLLFQHAPGALLIRTSWMFGPGGNNFVRSMMERVNKGQKNFRVVSDERGRPTYSRDLAFAIRLALEKGLRGVYHAANAGALTWYELAREVFELAGCAVQLTPVSAEEYAAAARRPRNSVLDTSKFERDTGHVFRHHREALREYLEEEGWLSPQAAG